MFLPAFSQTKEILSTQADTVRKFDKKKVFLPSVTLGHSNFTGGNIKKKVLDSLLKRGLSGFDTLGNTYKVCGFDFYFYERNMYEDSAANLVMMTDMMYEYCPGDTITKGISETIYNRTKAGDTLLFDKVKVVKFDKMLGAYMPDSNAVLAMPLKCVITK